jgi:hypothetical protein
VLKKRENKLKRRQAVPSHPRHQEPARDLRSTTIGLDADEQGASYVTPDSGGKNQIMEADNSDTSIYDERIKQEKANEIIKQEQANEIIKEEQANQELEKRIEKLESRVEKAMLMSEASMTLMRQTETGVPRSNHLNNMVYPGLPKCAELEQPAEPVPDPASASVPAPGSNKRTCPPCTLWTQGPGVLASSTPCTEKKCQCISQPRQHLGNLKQTPITTGRPRAGGPLPASGSSCPYGTPSFSSTIQLLRMQDFLEREHAKLSPAEPQKVERSRRRIESIKARVQAARQQEESARVLMLGNSTGSVRNGYEAPHTLVWPGFNPTSCSTSCPFDKQSDSCVTSNPAPSGPPMSSLPTQGRSKRPRTRIL